MRSWLIGDVLDLVLALAGWGSSKRVARFSNKVNFEVAGEDDTATGKFQWDIKMVVGNLRDSGGQNCWMANITQ